MNQLAQQAVCIWEEVRTPHQIQNPVLWTGLVNRGVEGESFMILSAVLSALILLIGSRGAKLKIKIRF